MFINKNNIFYSSHFSHVTKSRILQSLNLRIKADCNFRGNFWKNHFRHLKLHSNPPSGLAISHCHYEHLSKDKRLKFPFLREPTFQILVRENSLPKKN